MAYEFCHVILGGYLHTSNVFSKDFHHLFILVAPASHLMFDRKFVLENWGNNNISSLLRAHDGGNDASWSASERLRALNEGERVPSLFHSVQGQSKGSSVAGIGEGAIDTILNLLPSLPFPCLPHWPCFSASFLKSNLP